MRILGISGSLRRDSHNTALLRAAAELLPDDVEFEIWDGLKTVPPYDQDDDTAEAPAEVAELRSRFVGADAVLIATPEYNASIPGQLKNALDWVSRPVITNPLRNKPAAVVGASTGAFGAVWAQAELRKVLSTIGARTLPNEVAVRHADTCFEGGRLIDDGVRAQLAETLDDLVAATRARAEAQAAAPFAA
jgi:chromate reductase